jgi:hypothetical protein
LVYRGWRPFAAQLCSICGAATNKQLTCQVTFRQPYLSVNGRWNRPAGSACYIKDTSPKEAVTVPHFLEIAASFVALLLGLTVWGEAPREWPIFARGPAKRAGKPHGKTFNGVS